MADNKTACCCGWRGMSSQMLVAQNPFDETDEVKACPQCRELYHECYRACDEPDCWEAVTCGTRTAGGYRNTCSEHRPKRTLVLGEE